jgi:hypothetical protein
VTGSVKCVLRRDCQFATHSLEKHAEMARKSSEMKEFQEAMKGYHDIVDHGRREIYQIEK